MAIQAVTSGWASSTTTTVVVNKPFAAQTGDVILFAHVHRGSVSTTGFPAGGTAVTGITNPVQSGTASSDVRLVLHWVAIDGSSPSSWTYTASTNTQHLVTWVLLRGVDTTDVIDIAAASGPDTLTAPTVSTTVPNTFLVYIGAHWNSAVLAQSFTVDAAMHEEIDISTSNTATVFATETRVATGATGTRTATPATTGSGSSSFVAALVAFTTLPGNVKAWDGTSWAAPVVKSVWNGSSWT